MKSPFRIVYNIETRPDYVGVSQLSADLRCYILLDTLGSLPYATTGVANQISKIVAKHLKEAAKEILEDEALASKLLILE
jgi:hypothetical protein